MPADVWYGADCEMRIGRRANAATPPVAWQSIEFMSFTANPVKERRERPKNGNPATRQNTLDPIKPRPGFERLTAELVADMDSRHVPIWLRYSVGTPAAATENPDDDTLFDHVWSSGGKAEQYFDVQIRVGANDVRIYECLTLASLSVQGAGENTQDFDLNLSLRGLSKRRVAAFEGGAPTACPDEAPMLRVLYRVDDVAADNTLNASFSWDRALQEGVFLSTTPTVSSNRPNVGASHTMSATFRAIGAVFDEMDEDDTVFSAALDYVGVQSGHRIRLEQPQSMLQPGAMPISGGGLIERTFSSMGHQSATVPATVITVTNDIAAYA